MDKKVKTNGHGDTPRDSEYEQKITVGEAAKKSVATTETVKPGEKKAEKIVYQPAFRLLAEYLKDLSFENPSLVRAFTGDRESLKNPKVDIQVNIRSRKLDSDKELYETDLTVEAQAKKDGKTLFSIEAVYAAIVEAVNVPKDKRDALLLIEIPRFLFPFMRETIARETQRGGLQPILLEPIDFVDLFRRRQQEIQKRAQQKAAQDNKIKIAE